MSDKVVNLLERALNSRGKKLTKADEYMFYSPFVNHYKPKLQINVSTQKWHCWISNTGGHSIYSLFKRINVNRELYAELKGIFFVPSKVTDDKVEVAVLPKNFIPLWKSKRSLYRGHALKFLKDRGFDNYDIKKYKIGFCEDGLYQHRIIIPSHDENGMLNYFVGRSFMESSMKYKNPNVSKDVVGFDYYIAWSEPIVLCEGVFDAMSIRTNAIPMFGKKPSRKLLMKIFEKKVKTIYIALDDDARKDAFRLSEFFSDFGIDTKVVDLPKDKDPNDLGFETMSNLIAKTMSSSFSDTIQARLYG